MPCDIPEALSESLNRLVAATKEYAVSLTALQQATTRSATYRLNKELDDLRADMESICDELIAWHQRQGEV
jgi:phosphate uptake regulator